LIIPPTFKILRNPYKKNDPYININQTKQETQVCHTRKAKTGIARYLGSRKRKKGITIEQENIRKAKRQALQTKLVQQLLVADQLKQLSIPNYTRKQMKISEDKPNIPWGHDISEAKMDTHC
jgi:hypothetical protein